MGSIGIARYGIYGTWNIALSDEAQRRIISDEPTVMAGKVVVEVELDAAQTARRLLKEISEVYGHTSDLSVLSA